MSNPLKNAVELLPELETRKDHIDRLHKYFVDYPIEDNLAAYRKAMIELADFILGSSIIRALEASRGLAEGTQVIISRANFDAISNLSRPSEYRMPGESVKNLEAIYTHHLRALASPAPEEEKR